MKKFLSVCTALILVIALSLSVTVSAKLSDFTPVEKDGEYLKFMSFNLRYDTTSHPLMSEQVRGPHLMSLIEGYGVDSVGFCEATDTWMKFLRPEMAKLGYSYVGAGRDNGLDDVNKTGTGNEFTPVFYRNDKYELVDSDTFWLSRTPDVKSGTDWNAANTRICTYAVLKNKATGEMYAHFATHLDHVSETARLNGVRIIMARIDEIREKYDGIPVLLTGDLNQVSSDENADYGETTFFRMLSSRMDSSAHIAEKTVIIGNTMSGYQNPATWDGTNNNITDVPSVDYLNQAIDYLFLTKGLFEVKTYTVVNDTFDFDYNGTHYEGHACSDHWGVYCEAKLKEDGVPKVDESKIINQNAKEYVGGRDTVRPQIPEILDDLPNLSETANFTSNIDTASSANGLSKGEGCSVDSSKYTGNVFWEVTAALQNESLVSAVSFTVGEEGTIPGRYEIMGSRDGSKYDKIGGTITSAPAAGETSYILLDEPAEYTHIKLVMPDCSSDSKLADISVYGISVSNTVRLSGNAFTPLSGPAPGEKEGYEKAFDGDSGTKFYCREENYNTDLVWKTGASVTAVGYSFTTANDTSKYSLRNPHTWTLYGSNDNKNWTVLDSKTGDNSMPASDYIEVKFDIDNPAPFEYYKLNFSFADTSAESGIKRVQVSEIALFEDSGEELIDPESLRAVAYAEIPETVLNVENGQTLSADMLPETAYVLLKSGAEASFAIDWDIAGVDTSVAGEQTVKGTLVLDKNAKNPDNITVEAKIIVAPSDEPDYLRGDADFNGVVNVSDMITLKNMVMTGQWSDKVLKACDLNDDGILSVADILSVKNIIMAS